MKLFRYLIIYWTTKDALLSAKIYQMIYYGINNFDKELPIYDHSPVDFPKPPKVSDKKQEIIDSLNYLKAKPSKSKRDHESIYSLEMILKNIK
jgi:hypothetical protein